MKNEDAGGWLLANGRLNIRRRPLISLVYFGRASSFGAAEGEVTGDNGTLDALTLQIEQQSMPEGIGRGAHRQRPKGEGRRVRRCHFRWSGEMRDESAQARDGKAT